MECRWSMLHIRDIVIHMPGSLPSLLLNSICRQAHLNFPDDFHGTGTYVQRSERFASTHSLAAHCTPQTPVSICAWLQRTHHSHLQTS
jgi:hypothetical protein